jgi:hypothetical protein
MRIKIFSSGGPTGTSVELDGVPLKLVKSVTFRHDVGDVPTVVIECIALNGVELTGEADVILRAIEPPETYGT